MDVVKGWVFNTADFSMKAHGKSDTGRVTLVRDIENRKKWHALPDHVIESDDCPPLEVIGRGRTFEEAVKDANSKAAKAPAID